MIVVDPSALIEVLLNTPAASGVASKLFASGQTLHAPHVIDLDVAQVLRRFVLSKNVSAHRARQAIDDLAAMPLTRYPHDLLLPRIWAMRDNLTAYDAAYLAFAESLGATLMTRDAALLSVPGHRARVMLVGP